MILQSIYLKAMLFLAIGIVISISSSESAHADVYVSKTIDQNGWVSVVDSSGNIYVDELQNRVIAKYDSNGNFITKWGSVGNGNGQFGAVYNIAVDSSGNIYTSDAAFSNIQKFDSNGNFITKWGTNGSANGQFYNPQGIAIDKLGNIYVADGNNHRIQKFDTNGNFITNWKTPTSAPVGITPSTPTGIAVDSSGNVYVGDNCGCKDGNALQKFDTNGNLIAKWGDLGIGNYVDSANDRFPIISIDSHDIIYANGFKFDTNGNLLAKGLPTGTIDSKGNFYAGSVESVLNDSPVANNQTFTIYQNSTAFLIHLTGSDKDDPTLIFDIKSRSYHGTLTGFNADYTYTPDPLFSGTDSFTFTANDGHQLSNIGTVTIIEKPVNHPPQANYLTVTANQDTPTHIVLTGSDIDGDKLAYSVITNPSHGTLSGLNSTGDISYISTSHYYGTDSFTFKANDGYLDSNISTVSITVNPLPSANAGSNQVVNSGSIVTLDGTGSSDADGDKLAYSWTQTAGQPVILSNTNTPNPTFAAPSVKSDGFLTFLLTVDDGKFTKSASVTITVKPSSISQPVQNTTNTTQLQNQTNHPLQNITNQQIIPQQTSNIPSWVKGNAKYWHDGTLGDDEFEKGIKYMIDNKIIKTEQKTQTNAGLKSIPKWIKNNAGWWADGTISQDDFLKGIEYLVEKGIINVQ